jgi:hypothetical protein
MALSITQLKVFRGKIRKTFWSYENASMQEMFIEDKARADKFNLQWNDFNWLFKKYKTGKLLSILVELANEMGQKALSKIIFRAVL